MRASYGMWVGPKFAQEDGLRVGETVLQEEESPAPRSWEGEAPLLLLVADGLGGNEDGERASRFACEAFVPPDDADGVIPALETVQRRMETAYEGDARSGSTLAGVLVLKSEVVIFNAGDARVYALEPDGELRRVSRDHSLVQEQLDAGEITPERARRHPFRNVVTFGLGPGFARDWAEREHQPWVEREAWRPGRRYLLCTDGVYLCWEGEEALRGWLAEGGDLPVRLLNMVVDRAEDNAAFILLEL